MLDLEDKKPTNAIIGSTVRSIASSFPITASIATAWSEYSNHRQQQRVEEFLNSMARRLDETQNELAQFTAQVEELPDTAELMELCIKACIRETDEHKRKIYSDVYCNFLQQKIQVSEEDRLNVIFQLEQLTIKDLNLLIQFANSQYPISGDSLTNTPHGIGDGSIGGPQKGAIALEREFLIKHAPLMQSIIKLETRGLIRSASRSTSFSTRGNSDTEGNRFRKKAWVATYTGMKLSSSVQTQ